MSGGSMSIKPTEVIIIVLIWSIILFMNLKNIDYIRDSCSMHAFLGPTSDENITME